MEEIDFYSFFMERNMSKTKHIYNHCRFLKECPICGKEYDMHWKVVSHIRKTKDQDHQELLREQELEVLKCYKNNTKHNFYLKDMLYKSKNIFSGISYERILGIVDRYISSEELEKIRKERISVTLKGVPKTVEHNKNVSKAVKKAWDDGKFDTKEYKKAKEIGYKNRRSYKGKNNPMYGKPSPKGAGFGKGGIRKDIGHYVRSTWEANLCRVCNLVDRKYLYEPTRFDIIVDGVDCTYCPDLYFSIKNFYYEIKGHAKSSAKWICPCKTCQKNRKKIEEVRKKYGVKIIIIGHEEYKKFKRRFKKLIPNWEK